MSTEPDVTDAIITESGCNQTDFDLSDLNETLNQSTTVNESGEQSKALGDESSMEISKLNETEDFRNSLDDGIGGSLANSPVQMAELDQFERNMLNPVVEVHDIFYPMNKYLQMPNDLTIDLNGPLKEMLSIDRNSMCPSLLPLESNVFQIPEKLLRRSKIFKLTDDFDLWIAARKRKSNTYDIGQPMNKLMKLSAYALHVQKENQIEECDDEVLIGFNPDFSIVMAKKTDVPASILERTFSADSGIIDKTNVPSTMESEIPNDSAYVSDLNDTNNTMVNDTVVDQTLNVSGENINSNSTQIGEKSQTLLLETSSLIPDSLLNDTYE